MRYDVKVRLQGIPVVAENAGIVLDTQGELTVLQGKKYHLHFSQYDQEDNLLLTDIHLDRDTVMMARSNQVDMLFFRDRPSLHMYTTPSGDSITMTVIPRLIDLSQRQGRGYLHLAYDMAYEGDYVCNHDLLVHFSPAYMAN